jgi:23S rRNA (uracil1939-C5)-methyltransferase
MLSFIGPNFSDKDNLINYFKEHENIKTITINNEIVYGNGYIIDSINSLQYKISPLSFYQVNSIQTNELYKKVLEYANLSLDDTVFDLYCGIGTITLLLAEQCKKVIGIEVIEDAIKDAKVNAEKNKINNTEFMLGKVEQCLPDLLDENIDVIVMDPPRDGVDKKALASVVEINPDRIIYASCNPVTLARDLRYLIDNDYEIKEITPIDMFPETEHVECVCQLVNKR